MDILTARSRLKIVPTELLQTAYRGLVRLQDKRLSAGSTSHGTLAFGALAGQHCGCILTVAAIQHYNKKKRISTEAFQKKLLKYDIYDLIAKIDPSVGIGEKADKINQAMYEVNDNYRSQAVRNSAQDQRERYIFVKNVLTAELTARNALPVPKPSSK